MSIIQKSEVPSPLCTLKPVDSPLQARVIDVELTGVGKLVRLAGGERRARQEVDLVDRHDRTVDEIVAPHTQHVHGGIAVGVRRDLVRAAQDSPKIIRRRTTDDRCCQRAAVLKHFQGEAIIFPSACADGTAALLGERNIVGALLIDSWSGGFSRCFRSGLDEVLSLSVVSNPRKKASRERQRPEYARSPTRIVESLCSAESLSLRRLVAAHLAS